MICRCIPHMVVNCKQFQLDTHMHRIGLRYDFALTCGGIRKDIRVPEWMREVE